MYIMVEHNGVKYYLNHGSEAYILECAFCCGLDEKYSQQEILTYVDTVHECYLKDDGYTPLGHLADFMAEEWETVKDLPPRVILEQFYSSI